MWIKHTCRLLGEWIQKCVCVDVCLPMTEVKSSGAELPAAMNVAPATSSLSWRRYKREERVRISNVTFTLVQSFPVAFSYLAYLLQWGHKVIITNQSQSIKHVDRLQGKIKTHMFLFYIFWKCHNQHFKKLLWNFIMVVWRRFIHPSARDQTTKHIHRVLGKYATHAWEKLMGNNDSSTVGQVILTHRTCRPTAPSMRSSLVK